MSDCISENDGRGVEVDLDGGDLLLHADALAIAAALPDGCLDLIYLDPPFGSGRDRKGLRGRNGRFGTGGVPAFADPTAQDWKQNWLPGLLAETRRLLRPGGALFLHLDYRAVRRARILLDEILGADNFLNEIIWHYATGGIPARCFARKHDNILYYRNGPGHTFHRLRERKNLAHRMCRPGVEEFQDERGWYRYRYLDDVWEIPWLTQDSRERTGYPTQKPLALLDRILRAATNEGDRVGDFCCGSGTTAVAASRLGRRWIACDTSEFAIRTARARLEALAAQGRLPLEGPPGEPGDDGIKDTDPKAQRPGKGTT